jgi:hypothetical protein
MPVDWSPQAVKNGNHCRHYAHFGHLRANVWAPRNGCCDDDDDGGGGGSDGDAVSARRRCRCVAAAVGRNDGHRDTGLKPRGIDAERERSAEQGLGERQSDAAHRLMRCV